MNDFNNKYHISNCYLAEPRTFDNIQLYQIGRSFCQKDTVITEHKQQDYIELTIVTGGSGFASANGDMIAINCGDIFVSFPGDMHSIISCEESPLKYDFISLMPTDSEFVEEIRYISRVFHSANLRTINSKTISDCVASAIAELKDERFAYECVLGALLKEITVLTLREFQRTDGPIRQRAASESDLLCYRIMNYIDCNANTISSLDELTKKFSYSYNYLSNLFKKTTGDTLTSYYRRRRLENAKSMLSEGKVKVTDIALTLGYSSVYTFSRAYKKEFGISPKTTRVRVIAK